MGDSSTSATAALPYHEPGIITILILSSFLLILNVSKYVLDNLIYCGLIGQMLVGVAWGVPGAQWLPQAAQVAMVQLGYLGLILLVYEGGLSTNTTSLRANALMSCLVAITGIVLPVSMSFILIPLLEATPLQAFAAGAALCSTSLGTTFTILLTTGLNETRLGVVLISAAILDDIVGLVMVQVISNLGNVGNQESFNVVTVVRPVLVSVAFAVGVLLICRFILKPLRKRLHSASLSIPRFVKPVQVAFVAHTLSLIALVTAATFAGTSGLFAAYLAGAAISWWDSETNASEPAAEDGKTVTPGSGAVENLELEVLPEGSQSKVSQNESQVTPETTPQVVIQGEVAPDDGQALHQQLGVLVYERYYSGPVNSILKPLFFASLGFSIPITRMFRGSTVWRGLVYTALMSLAKIATGLWLIRMSFGISFLTVKLTKPCINLPMALCFRRKEGKKAKRPEEQKQTKPAETETDIHQSASNNNNPNNPQTQHSSSSTRSPLPTDQSIIPQKPKPITHPKPRSLYPATIIGTAMVSRGEIGFLIASVAESSDIFRKKGTDSSEKDSEIYLVVVWAITLCTIIGPLAVGILVKRVKKLQAQRQGAGGYIDPLGVWGLK
ncbi:hypothetical protein AJ80_04672 [Polytolypa hystricis UAMH7299]|uniref:Cation/H+ exchanger transmembrane domain-containing protein n=1 Tax=Polytolypa hystricis (strain UAMH7299) TaxID=1447883 RepID=A0A2B7Y9S9_POLH7|nr:hypothetical protein AJ80_04672 [Polytolypa hystricis UAMH7299]